MKLLKITSIFTTIDGEVTHGGPWQWTTFVRLGGCNLRCWKSSGFCDAPHTLDLKYPYPERTPDQVFKKVEEMGVRRVTITGGEPLLQEEPLHALMQLFVGERFITTLETSGSLPINRPDYFNSVIMDVKPPSTQMAKKNFVGNMARLRAKDYVKFVLEDYADFEWALGYIEAYPTKAKVAFGVRYNYLEPRTLLEWLREKKLWNIQLNLQSHKFIFPECHPEPVRDLGAVDYGKQVELEH